MTENQKRIYNMLSEHSDKRVTLFEMAEKLGITKQNLNRHLQALDKKGLITRKIPKLSELVKVRPCKTA